MLNLLQPHILATHHCLWQSTTCHSIVKLFCSSFFFSHSMFFENHSKTLLICICFDYDSTKCVDLLLRLFAPKLYLLSTMTVIFLLFKQACFISLFLLAAIHILAMLVSIAGTYKYNAIQSLGISVIPFKSFQHIKQYS